MDSRVDYFIEIIFQFQSLQFTIFYSSQKNKIATVSDDSKVFANYEFQIILSF